MSLSKSWRADLELAKQAIIAKGSRHLRLFQQIDLTRFLDDDYISKLNDRNELHSKLVSPNDLDLNLNEEEICAFWQYQVHRHHAAKAKTNNEYEIVHDIQSLSHFLISQTSSLCQGNVHESMRFKRQLLLQTHHRYVHLSQTDKNQQLIPKRKQRFNQLQNSHNKSNRLMDSIESSEAFICLPFEAQIGIKLLLSTLNSIDVKQDKEFSFKIIKALLPHLNDLISTLSHKYYSQNGGQSHLNAQSNQDFGLLTRICNFLCSMIDVVDTANDETHEILAPILSIILALSIISNDFDTIIYVIHRILTNPAYQNLDLCIYEALNMISVGNLMNNTENSKNASSMYSSGTFDGGNLYVFGKGEHGRLGLSEYASKTCTNPTVSAKFNAENCIEIAAFSSHNLCIDSEGHTYSFGKGDNGRLGSGSTKTIDVPRLIEPLQKYKALHVAVGLSHSLVLTEDGNIWSFGCGEHGRLGHGDTAELRAPKLIETIKDAHIAHIACGAYHSVAISNNGRLWTWGKNDQGQCGLGSVANKDVLIPALVNLDNVSNLDGDSGSEDKLYAAYCASGWEHTLMITTDGLLLSWGTGYEGHRPVLGHGTEKGETAPKIIEALRNQRIVDVSCGWDHSMAVTDSGKLYTWGDGSNGRLGHGAASHQTVPKLVEWFNEKNVKIVSCEGGSTHSAVIAATGELYMFGNGADCQLGQGSGGSAQKLIPTKVKLFDGISIARVSLGDKYTQCISGKPVANSSVYNPMSAMLARRSSMAGLERRRSSLFSGTDLRALVNENQQQLMITYEDRLSRDEYRIHDDEEKKTEEEEAKTDEKEKDEAGPNKEKLEEMKKNLKLGDEVALTNDRKGQVKYIGPVTGQDEMIGVELHSWSPDAKDGRYDGFRYFTAPDGRGVFVKRDAITDVIPLQKAPLPISEITKLELSEKTTDNKDDDENQEEDKSEDDDEEEEEEEEEAPESAKVFKP